MVVEKNDNVKNVVQMTNQPQWWDELRNKRQNSVSSWDLDVGIKY